LDAEPRKPTRDQRRQVAAWKRRADAATAAKTGPQVAALTENAALSADVSDETARSGVGSTSRVRSTPQNGIQAVSGGHDANRTRCNSAPRVNGSWIQASW
jgi:hypothetical protein